MIREGKMAAVGDKDLVLAFKAAGVDVFTETDPYALRDLIKKLARDYMIIFITENLAEKIEDTIEKYRTRAYPAIIPIPMGANGTGYAMTGLKKDVERAIGADILFNKD